MTPATSERLTAPPPQAAAERLRQGADKRERILAAATDQFAAKGLAGARVDEIARAAQVNKQLVYYYFGGKLGLYNEVLGHMIEESRQKIDAEAACETLAERMQLLTRVGMHPNSARWQRLLGWEALEANPNESEIIREEDRRGAWQRHLASVLDAQRSGEVDPELDPEALALALVSIAILPYVLPQVTKFITGTRPTDNGFLERYEALVGQLIAHLRANA
jgi:TetR/AcrR family transcriptional regulator